MFGFKVDTPAVLPDSIPTPKQDFDMLANLPLDELLANLINVVVTFVIHLAVAILVFYIGRFLIKKLYKLAFNLFVKRKIDLSLRTFVLSMIKILLYFILIVTVIGILGLETSSFLAIFASAGVAIGMALSGTLQNFAGGVLILLLKPYKIGDYIEAQGFSGTVKEIQIFSTIITTPDNKAIIVPNGPLSTGSINNWSKMDYRRVDWVIGISYGDNVEAARNQILDILNDDPDIIESYPDPLIVGAIKEVKPAVVVKELAASSVDLKVTAWVKTPDFWKVYYRINEQIYTNLAKAGVSFPFPQLDVHFVPQEQQNS